MTDHEQTALTKLERLLVARRRGFAPATKLEIVRLAIGFESFWKCLDHAVEDALDLHLALRRSQVRRAG